MKVFSQSFCDSLVLQDTENTLAKELPVQCKLVTVTKVFKIKLYRISSWDTYPRHPFPLPPEFKTLSFEVFPYYVLRAINSSTEVKDNSREISPATSLLNLQAIIFVVYFCITLLI